MNHSYYDADPSAPTSFEPEELPSLPRRPRRRVMAETAPAAPSVSIAADTIQRPAELKTQQPPRQPQSQPQQQQRKPEGSRAASTRKARSGPGFFERLRADKRPAIFAGIVCLVSAIYLIVAFISFFATAGSADQSILHTGGLDGAIDATANVVNAGGPLGAWLAETLISQGLGLGALIIPYYFSVLGLCLVGLAHRNFWKLTAKSLLSMIAISVVVGMVTYNMTTTIYWGGRHGHDINMLLKQTAGVWGMIGVSIILVASVAMIFLRQISNMCASIAKVAAKRREAAEARRSAREARMAQQTRETARSTENTDAAAPVAVESDIDNEQPEPQPQTAAPDPLEVLETAEPEPSPEPKPELPQEPIVQSRPEPRHPMASPVQPPIEYQQTAIQEQAEVVAEDAAAESSGVDTIVDAAPIELVSEAEQTHDFYDPTAELSMFRKPSLDLLFDHPEEVTERNEQEQAENINNIRRVLSNFGIGIARIEATVGPTVTLYEIVPAEGVRINRIRSLEDDIALSLSALGIRIIAPMPGKGTIGIEVPNKKPRIVSIRSILASRKYQESTAELPMAMGATISNDVYIADLTKMPHLLVAGSTGMGKSVGLNTIIASILYKKHPAELKFVLIDPKMVEFSLYNKIERHYLAKLPGEDEAIITNTEKVVPTLLSLCMEMDNRYELLKKANVRSIREYNDKFVNMRLNPTQGHRYLPYIVVVIDEFADLIMTAGKEVETPIARIAQKARAVGIHVILATQRPSANIITGVIRANFPGRIAFRVTQQLESRIILDRPGANQLIGRGDMLFSRDGIIDRVQCAFIDTPEVEAICDAIGHQAGYPMAYELPEYVPPTAEGADGATAGVSIDRDPLFEAAAREVLDQNVGSTTLLQRRFEIGYPRAGKIMDQLERAGVVGPAQGGKPRKVLMTHMDFDQWLACTGTTQYTPLNCDKAAPC